MNYTGDITDPWSKALNQSFILDLVWNASRDLSVLHRAVSILQPSQALHVPHRAIRHASARHLSRPQRAPARDVPTAMEGRVAHGAAVRDDAARQRRAAGQERVGAARVGRRDCRTASGSSRPSTCTTSRSPIQRAIVEYTSPTGFEIRPGLGSLQQIVRSTDPEALRLCGMVMIQSVDHTLFSVLGLVLILVPGSGFIVLNCVLAKAVRWAQTKTR